MYYASFDPVLQREYKKKKRMSKADYTRLVTWTLQEPFQMHWFLMELQEDSAKYMWESDALDTPEKRKQFIKNTHTYFLDKDWKFDDVSEIDKILYVYPYA